MDQPFNVQHCYWSKGKLLYGYVGAAEYECGGQTKSLKRWLPDGIATTTQEYSIFDYIPHMVNVYVLASPNFDFDTYSRWLYQLANNEIRLQEPAYFHEAVVNLFDNGNRFTNNTTTWFDFPNDVMWTLAEDEADRLETHLLQIAEKWGL